MNLLFILDTSALTGRWFPEYFLPMCSFSFHSLIVSSKEQVVLISVKSSFYLFFYGLCFSVIAKKSFPTSRHKGFLLFLKVLYFLILCMLRSMNWNVFLYFIKSLSCLLIHMQSGSDHNLSFIILSICVFSRSVWLHFNQFYSSSQRAGFWLHWFLSNVFCSCFIDFCSDYFFSLPLYVFFSTFYI